MANKRNLDDQVLVHGLNASQKRVKNSRAVARVSKAPDHSGSKPHAAKGRNDDLEVLSDSLKRHKSHSAEEITSDEKADLSHEPEQQQSGTCKEEVDDLFAKLKRHRAPEKVLRKQVLEKRRPAGSKDDIFGRGVTKGRRRDADGFAIYSEEELGISKGGGTPQCPFECECCF